MKHIFVIKNSDLQVAELIEKTAVGLDHIIFKIDFPAQIKDLLAPYCNQDNRIYIFGGDGMIHNAIQILAHQKAALAIIPRGTGNDFARNLNRFHDVQRTIRECGNNQFNKVDLIKANDIYVVNTFCFGIDSDCANHVHHQKIVKFVPGGFFYAKMTLQRIFKFAGFFAKIKTANQDVEGKFILGVVANGRYYGGGYQVAKGKIDDGWFELGYMLGQKKMKAVAELLKLATNRILTDPHYHYSNHQKITIETAAAVNIDGETYPPGFYDLKIDPGALRILNTIKKT